MARDTRDAASAEAGPSSRPMAPDVTGGLDAGANASQNQAMMERFWQAANEAAQPAQRSIRRRLPRFPSPALRVQRVSQLDAELLDAELTSMLLEPVKAALRNVRSTLPTSLEPELLLMLRLILFKFSIVDRGATYGAMLQNLRYRNEWAHRGGLQSTSRDASLSRVQLTLFPALTILLPYAHTKIEQQMSNQSYSDMPANDIRRQLWSGLDRAQRVYSALSLANFLAFLGDGKYRTVTDRILGMRLTYAQRTMNRNVSFEFLNRQLVWHAFTEFLLFLLPLIQPRRLLRRLLRLPTHPWVLAFWLAILPRIVSKRLGLYVDEKGRARFSMPQKLPFGVQNPLARGSAQSDATSLRASRAKYAWLPEGVCAICWERLETQAGVQSAGDSIASQIGGVAGDPNDPTRSSPAQGHSPRQRLPLDGAGQPIQPRGLAARTTKALSRLGTASSGLAFADASVHTPYCAEPCGHTYCYVCLAGKMLSEDAAETLQDSALDAGDDASSYDVATTEKGKARAPRRDDASASSQLAAWHCLRCGQGVRRIARDLTVVKSAPTKAQDDDDDGESVPPKPNGTPTMNGGPDH